MPREMTILAGGTIHSAKTQRVPSVSTDDPNASSSGKEVDEKTFVVLSDDSDSDDEKELENFLRSNRRRSFSSPKTVTLPSSDVLDCPNCSDPLKKPIFQCNNGHLACFSCCQKMKKVCSFCKLPIGDIRCRAMERAIKTSLVSCSNTIYGCKQITKYGNELLSHEKYCVYAPCSCPIKDCNYIGFYKDLNNHFRVTHKSEAALIMPFVLDRPIIFGLGIGDDDEKMVIFQEKKQGDLIVVHRFIGSHGVFVTVNHIAPMVPQVRKFSCSLAKVKQYSTLRLGLRVKNIQKLGSEEEHPEDDFMLIPSYLLSGDYMKMQICIGNEDEYTHI